MDESFESTRPEAIEQRILQLPPDSQPVKWWRSSHLTAADSGWYDQIYNSWCRDPDSVDRSWSVFFSELKDQSETQSVASHVDGLREVTESFHRRRSVGSAVKETPPADVTLLAELVATYRQWGYEKASLDPLRLNPQPASMEIDRLLDRFDIQSKKCSLSSPGIICYPTASHRR